MDYEEQKIINKRNKGDQDFITKEAKRILEEKKNGSNRSKSRKQSGRGNKGKG